VRCKHETPQWRLADCNEDGWKCSGCEHVFGFRPDFDREYTLDKVDAVMFWLVEHDLLYVSNASEASGIVATVVRLCRAADEYDQQTIVYLLAANGRERHAAFWREQAKQGMCSHPSRTLSARPTRRNPDGAVSRCNACGHEVKQGDSGALFATTEAGRE
jgi:hypothetical protein